MSWYGLYDSAYPRFASQRLCVFALKCAHCYSATHSGSTRWGERLNRGGGPRAITSFAATRDISFLSVPIRSIHGSETTQTETRSPFRAFSYFSWSGIGPYRAIHGRIKIGYTVGSGGNAVCQPLGLLEPFIRFGHCVTDTSTYGCNGNTCSRSHTFGITLCTPNLESIAIKRPEKLRLTSRRKL